MPTNKPYLKLNNVNPSSYTLEIEATPPAGKFFDFNNPSSVIPDEPNSRFTFIFNQSGVAPPPPPFSHITLNTGFTFPNSNPVKPWDPAKYEKITVILKDSTRTVGTATALTSKALIGQPNAPKLWLKLISTGNYDLYFRNSVHAISPPVVVGPVATINYNTVPPPPPGIDHLAFALSPTVSIITVHDTNSGLAEQGSTSSNDADAS